MSPRPNTVTHPRGRLPARVYWVRRGLVAATAIVLVFGFAHLLGALGGGSGGHDSAQLSADEASTSASGSPMAPLTPVLPSNHSLAPAASSPSASLAQPDGPCSPDQLSVAPVVSHAYAAHPVSIQLQLGGSSPACTFTVSAKSLAVKITSGKDSIWSSQDCPRSIKKQTVVVRSGQDTDVAVDWNGRRSNGDCSRANKWAMPGYYHVLAAVLGSTPADTQFKLTVAPRAVITKTAKAKPKDKGKDKASASKSESTKKSTTKDGGSGKGSKCGGDNAASSC